MAKGTTRVLIVSCNETHWGGSEELWGRSAIILAERGYRVTIAKPNVNWTQPVIRQLKELGCGIHDLTKFPLLPRFLYQYGNLLSKLSGKLYQMTRLSIAILVSRPAMAVLSQGGNWDGMIYSSVLRRLKIPYVVVSQKASDLYWPADWIRPLCKAIFTAARASYFVSEHNLRLTQDMLGIDIQNASVVRNPFLTDWNATVPWPGSAGPMRLACVGRLYPLEKGQDLLLRVLAQPKWRDRELTVSFFGEGDRLAGLKELAKYRGLRNVKFFGFVQDVPAIWKDHHALILPSRAEGLPLVLVEAMLAGRLAIVTDAGGSAELCIDGSTGFLAAAPTEASIDDALQRAWDAREQWEAMGVAAAKYVRNAVPADPPAAFARLVEEEIGKLTNLQASTRSQEDGPKVP